MANISGALERGMAEFNKAIASQTPMSAIKAASAKSEDGSVNAVFEISIPLVVTAAFSKEEIDGFTEENFEGDVHAVLAERADEMLSEVSVEDAIEDGRIIELRDGETDETIEGVLLPRLRTYAVIGRIPYDDEDSCHVFKAATRQEAIERFADLMYEEAVGEDREHNIEVHGCDLGVYINHVLVSESGIKEAE